MSFTSLFFDRGCLSKKNIPGFPNLFSMSAFPFFGEYIFSDFAVYNTIFSELDEQKNIVVCRKDIKRSVFQSFSRWEKFKIDIVAIDKENSDFLQNLQHLISTDTIIIYEINNVILFNDNAKTTILSELKNLDNEELVRLSVNSVPVDIYLIRKEYFSKLLLKYQKNIEKEKQYIEVIIDDILTKYFDRSLDVEGNIYFNNSIMQFYKTHIKLLNKDIYEPITNFITRAPGPAPTEKNSLISKKGDVVNSVISANVTVDGYVENSFLFSGVTVKNNARVINSVVLNGNIIGKNSVITNSIIFPNIKNEGIININEKTIVGNKSNSAINKNYPDQIYNGLTLLGFNTFLPKGFIIDAGGYLGPNVESSELKKITKISRNESLK